MARLYDEFSALCSSRVANDQLGVFDGRPAAGHGRCEDFGRQGEAGVGVLAFGCAESRSKRGEIRGERHAGRGRGGGGDGV